MNKICLFCGKPLIGHTNESYWHESCVELFFNNNRIPSFDLDENVFDNIAFEQVGSGSVVSGIQKKLSLEVESKRRKKTTFTNKYIIKPSEPKYPYLNEYEWIGNRLASICGFNVVQSGLIKHNDKYAYITKRIDRKTINRHEIKIAMEDFCQLSNKLTEQKYDGSYEKAWKNTINKYSKHKLIDTIEYFRMVFFSYIIGNTDMHLKNFSLISQNYKYILAPFYDLVPVLMIVNQDEMALTINGKHKNVTKNDFYKFGENVSLDKKMIDICFNSIFSKIDLMVKFIKNSPLNEKEQDRFSEFIKNRVKQFN